MRYIKSNVRITRQLSPVINAEYQCGFGEVQCTNTGLLQFIIKKGKNRLLQKKRIKSEKYFVTNSTEIHCKSQTKQNRLYRFQSSCSLYFFGAKYIYTV